MRKIFISYRRAEAEYAAGALGRELRGHFGEAQVFRDKEDIGGGASWKQTVLNEIDRDSALLVLIGANWVNAHDAAGNRRLDRADDPIVLEIADGIKDGASVIPILLENAVMPAEADLPAVLRPMAEFNALRLRDGDWQHDLERICKTLEKAGFKPAPTHEPGPGPAPVPPTPMPPAPPTVRGKSGKLIASYVVGALALFAYKDTHDAETYWGLAIFGVIALVLAVLAYLDYRKGLAQGMARGKWPAIGAMVLGGLCAVGYTGWALDPDVQGRTAQQDAAPAPPAPAQTGANQPQQPAPVQPSGPPVANQPQPSPQPAAGGVAAVPAVTNDADGFTNVRGGPGTNHPITVTVAAGEQFLTQPSSGPWWPVTTQAGVAGYMHKSRIVLQGQDTVEAAPAAARALATVANISGRWTDSEDGTVIVMSQDGNRVHMVATQQGIAIEGEGTLAGRQLDMALSMAGVNVGSLRMTLGPEGRRLQGTMNVQGEIERITFLR